MKFHKTLLCFAKCFRASFNVFAWLCVVSCVVFASGGIYRYAFSFSFRPLHFKLTSIYVRTVLFHSLKITAAKEAPAISSILVAAHKTFYMLVGNKFTFSSFFFMKANFSTRSHCGFSFCLYFLSFFRSSQLNGATYKSETKFSGGGVGRNIAEGLYKLNGAVSLISAFGRDQNGDFLRKTLPDKATGGSKISDTSPTANCAVILDKNGDSRLLVGDMKIHQEITPDLVRTKAFASDFM